MKILVTGGAGFIASHIVDAYVDAGYQVVVVDNLSTGNINNLNSKAKFYEIDITNPDLEKIFKSERPDFVNHHAAQISVPVSTQKPIFDAQINILGTLNILQNAVKYKVKKIIFASTGGAIYGDAEEYPTSENYVPSPVSPYAIAKLTVEKYLHYYNYQFGLKYLALRYSNVFGPRQIPHGEAGVVSIFIENILRKESSNLYSFPNKPDGMIRDYVFVGDVVDANLLGLKIGNNDIINIATNKETSTVQLYNQIAEILNSDITFKRGDSRAGDIRRSCLDISKAKKILNWSPKTELKKGIILTIKFFENKMKEMK
ncbi:MAG: NAD-dependent epimerase/dehydratase family protein [Candidatus Cloacimonetes bacterium]|nr:NAD-dependent epimerase/dehydratase family protein [Candidatus Cloacimonadota bacterium]